MKITKAVFTELTKIRPETKIHLLGAKTAKGVFSVSITLKVSGGCSHNIPAINSTDITSAMLELCRKGYKKFILAWTPSEYYGGKSPKPVVEKGVVGQANYFKEKAHGLDGVFVYPAGAYTVERNIAYPVEVSNENHKESI